MAVHAQLLNRIPNVNGRVIFFDCCHAHMPDTTVRLCEGLEFEIRLPSGNDNLERDYEIAEKFLRTSQAPNQS